MNWLQKLSQKPMALPAQPDRRSTGVDVIDNRMTDETAQQERDQHPEMSYLGSGNIGVAYDCAPGKVCKYTHDRVEAQVAELIKDDPKAGIVQIFDVQLIQERSPIWRIVSEKVSPLAGIHIHALHFIMHEGNPTWPEPLDEDTLLWRTKKYCKKWSLPFEEIWSLLNEWKDLCQKIQDAGLRCNDAHGENIGRNSQGELVLFDLGLALLG